MVAVKVGIHRLAAWVGSGALDLASLARARGREPEVVHAVIDREQRTVLAPWEDPVTQAVNAANQLLDEDPGFRGRVRWLLVATESSLDEEKPLSSWIHHWLELPPTCRNLEVKHACYGGTGALRLLLAWLVAEAEPEDLALVVTSDLSLLGIEASHEFVLGAGATAALLRRDPDLLEFEPGSRAGVHAVEVTDVIRPTPWLETGDPDTSLFAYFEGIDGAFDAYEAIHGPTDVAEAFDACVYHSPFGGLLARAHERLLVRSHEDWSRRTCNEHYQAFVAASQCVHRRVGGVYSGSTFLSLLGTLVAQELQPGARVGVYAYGSGSCAEYYAATLGPHPERVHDPRPALDGRVEVSVECYEAVERERHAARSQADYVPSECSDWQPRAGELVLRGVRDYVRSYGWIE